MSFSGGLNREPVDDGIHDDYCRAKQELSFPCQAGRIKDRNQVVVHESSPIHRLACSGTQEFFERRQRARSPGELDDRSPDCSRKMSEDHARPTKHEKATDCHEQDEGEVNHHHEIGENSIDHCANPSHTEPNVVQFAKGIP